MEPKLHTIRLRNNVQLLENFEYHQKAVTVRIDIYIEKIEEHPLDLIKVKFEKSSLQVQVKDFDNRHWIFSVPRLFREIMDKESKFFIEKDQIILVMVKTKPVIWDSIYYNHPSVLFEFERKFSSIIGPFIGKTPHSRLLSQPFDKIYINMRITAEMYVENFIDVEEILRGSNITIPMKIVRSPAAIVEFLKNNLSNRGYGIDLYIPLLALALFTVEKEKFVQLYPELARPKIKWDDSNQGGKNVREKRFEGNCHFKAKRYHEAIRAYTQAIALDPHSHVNYVRRASAYFESSEMSQGSKDANRAIDIDPFCSEGYLYLCKCFCFEGYFGHAKQCLYLSRRLDPGCRAVEAEIKNLKEMEDTIEKYVETFNFADCSLTDYFFSAITTSLQVSMMNTVVKKFCSYTLFPEAKKLIEPFLNSRECDVFHYNGLHLLILIAFFEDDEKRVHETFNKCSHLLPARAVYEKIQDVYAERGKGDQFFTSGCYNMAIDCYVNCLRECKGMYMYTNCVQIPVVCSKLFFKMAQTESILNRKLKAKANLSSAIDLKSDYHQALAERSRIYLEEGKFSEARDDIQNALKIYPCDNYKKLLEIVRQKQLAQTEELNKLTHASKDKNAESQKSAANSLKDQGNKFFKAGKYENAIEAYSEAIALHTQDSVYYSNRATCHLALKNFRDALKDANSALRLDSYNIKALLRLAKSQIALGQAEEAINALEKQTKLFKCVPQLNAEMENAKSLKDAITDGNFCLQNEDYVNAEKHFLTAVKLGEDCVSLRLKMIECVYHLEKYEDVSSAIESAFNLDAKNPTLHYFKGLCSYQKGEKNEAISLFEKALSFDPHQTKIRETLKKVKNVFQLKDKGNRAFSENRLEDAQNHYSEGLKEDPTNKAINAVFYFSIGLVHKGKGEFKKAIDSFSSAIVLKRNYGSAYLKRADCHLKLNQFKKALKNYQTLVKSSSCPARKKILIEVVDRLKNEPCSNLNDKDLEIVLAECEKENGAKYFSDKKYEDALNCFSEAITLNPTCASYYLSNCECHLAMGNYQNAVKEAEVSVEVDADYVEGYICVGKCHIALGNAEEAVTALEKARELDSTNDEVVEEIVKSLRLKKCLKKGVKAIQDKQFVAALEHLKIASDIATWNSALLLDRAECFFSLQRTNELKDLIASVANNLTECSDLLCMQGIFFYCKDNKEESLKYLKEALDADPLNNKAKEWAKRVENVYHIKELGNQAFLNQAFPAAFAFYDNALKLEPVNRVVRSKLFFNKGMLHMKYKKYTNAIEAFSKSVDLNEDYPKALERRAQCYREESDFHLAVQDYEKLYSLTSSKAHLKLLEDARKELDVLCVKDYYRDLCVSRDMSNEELTKSFNFLTWHLNSRKANTETDKILIERRLEQINEAYSVLSDPKKRERYDRGETEEEQDIISLEEIPAFNGGSFF